ncbi:hypothetical protein KJ708_06900 [bacterium]|nr:hypothetical protein [bacterium]MBU1917821.1 hypothetical protein [bacterium]
MYFGSSIFLAPMHAMSTTVLGPVTLTGVGNTQDLNSFLTQIDSSSPGSFEQYPAPTIQPERFRATEARIDRALGGSGLVGVAPENITQWQRPVPAHRATTQTAQTVSLNISQATQLANQITDPVLLEVHMSLLQAGYLRYDDQRNCFCMRCLTDWREGVEVIEILYAHTQETNYDIMDFIHKIDWGKIDSYGFKGINASFRSLGEFERHKKDVFDPTNVLSMKGHCLGHVFQGRLFQFNLLDVLGFVINSGKASIDAKKSQMIAQMQAATSYDALARLIIEVEVGYRMRDIFKPDSPNTKPSYLYGPLSVLFNKKHADYLTMSREEYEAMHEKRFREIWDRVSVRPRNAQTASLDLIKNTNTYGPNGLYTTDTPDPEDLVSIDAAKEIRELNIELAYIAGVMPPSLVPLLQALRIASFLLSLAQALPKIDKLEGVNQKEHVLYCLQSFARLCQQLHDRLQNVDINTLPSNPVVLWPHNLHDSPRAITEDYLRDYFKTYPPFKSFRQYIEFAIDWAKRKSGLEQTAPYAATISSLIDLWEEKMPFTSDAV